jgi:biotin-dependent carboxylase-like uncharacterized protein
VIEVLAPGPLTTVQDRGRPNLQRYGIPVGGAADRFSAAVANLLVGNPPDAALLECTFQLPAFRCDTQLVIAVTGGIVNSPAAWRAHRVEAGATAPLGRAEPGLRSYLAVRGGIAVDAVLGSRSLCLRGAFGGGYGRPLRAGDRLPVGEVVVSDPISAGWPPEHRLPLKGPWEVRIIPGPHLQAFPSDTLERFLNCACQVTPNSDRMGMRLRTPGLRLRGSEILTTPMPEGGIQVTPSGELIVMLADHPTTGGYPLIATVIDADLPLLAQARPGDTVHFRASTHEEAARARRRLAGWLDE